MHVVAERSYYIGFQMLMPEWRVLELPGASLRFIKKRFKAGEKGFGGNRLLNYEN